MRALGDLCQLISGQHINSSDYNTTSRGVGYLTGPADFGPLNPTVSKWTERPKVTARCGDILITVKGSGVGKINLLDQEPVAISRQLMAIRVRGADPHYVRMFLSSAFEHFQSLSTGAAIPGISREQVLGLRIPVPSLLEQRRIVTILDKAFAAIATAKANTDKNLQNARAVLESHLRATLNGAGRGHWRQRRLAELAETISTGPFGTMLHKSDYVPNGIPLVNPVNIVGSRIVPSGRMMVSERTRERLSAYVLKAGDIVVARRGELGRCAQVSHEQSGWLCGTGSFFIRLSSEIDGKFFVAVFGSREFRERLERMAIGATMSNLNHSILNELAIPVPPMSEQRAVIARREGLLREIGRIESLYHRKLVALDELKKSLLHEAFNGRL